MKIVLTIIYLICTTGGVILMKIGGNSLSFMLKDSLGFKIGYITLGGFFLYLISFLLWQKLLISFDLTYIVPITAGIVQVLILGAGIMIFHEKVNIYGLAGTLLVIIGIILIALGRK
jgi:drug/metabolite transporter (DMT)-like permease